MGRIAPEPDLDAAIGRLYALPLDEFTAARDALAKQRRSSGDKDGAAEVKALRKPTAAAWAVNQLSRKNAKALDDLLDLGDQLRNAQRAALSGRGASTLRDLSAERRKAIEALTKKAVAHLGGTGDAQREAIATTLEAAVAAEDAADAVREGRLVKDLPPPSNFGEVPALTVVPDEDDAGDSASSRARRRAERAARRGVSAASGDGDPPAADDSRSRELEGAVAEKEAALERSASEAVAAAHAAAAARAEVSRLQDQLVTANGHAKAAVERARVAQWAHVQAQQDLDAAQRKLDAER